MAVSNLTIQVGANISGASRALGLLESQVGGFGRALNSISQIAGGMAVGQILTNVVTDITNNFHEAITATTDLGAAVYKLQGIAGGTAESTSALLEVFARYNVDATSAGNALGIFGRHLAGIEDLTEGVIVAGASFRTSMAALGVEFTDATGKARPMQEVLLATAEKFQNLGPGIDRTSIAMQLFGRAGKDMIPVLALGREGLQEAMDAAARYGLTLSAENVNQIRSFSRAQKDLDAALGGVTLSIGKLAIPALASLAKAVAYDAEVFNEKIIPALNAFGEKVGTVSARAALDYNAVADAVDRVNRATNIGKAVQQIAPPAAVQSGVSTGVGVLTAGAENLALSTVPAVRGVLALDSAIGFLNDRFGSASTVLDHYQDRMDAIQGSNRTTETYTANLRETVNHLGDTLGNVVGITDELTQSYITQHSAALDLVDATNALIAAHKVDEASQVITPLFSTDPTSSRREAAESLGLLQSNLADSIKEQEKLEKAHIKAGKAAAAAYRPFEAQLTAIDAKMARIELGPLEKQLARMLARPINPNRPTSELPRLNLERQILQLRGTAGITNSKFSAAPTIHVNAPLVHVNAINSPADADMVAAKMLDALLAAGKTANTAPKTLPGAN